MSTKIVYTFMLAIGILTQLVQVCNASLFFIDDKDEIEAGYRQDSLFKKSEDVQKLIKIQEIGNRLANISRKRQGIDYVFSLIKEENAFSNFAGFIYIGEPIYELLNSEDELAFVIAHEMAHSDNRDTADSIEQGIAERYKDKEETKITISEEMLRGYFFDRIQEYRADSQAILYLYLAGYDPKTGIIVMEKFQKKYGLYPPGLEKVSDHPSYVSRKRNMEAFLKELQYVEKFYFRDGEGYLEKKNYEEAIRSFSNYLAFFYTSYNGYFKRGYAYYLQAVGGVARDEFIWDDRIDFTGKFGVKGTERTDKLLLLKAKNDWEQAKSLNPQKAEVYNYLGIVDAELGEKEKALENLESAMQKDSKFCAPYNNLGVVYLREGKLEEAKKYLTISFANCSENLPLNFNLGQLYKIKGEKEKARKYFEKVIDLDNNKNGYLRKFAEEKIKDL